MISFIRRMMDVNRLTKELDAAEQRIEELEALIKATPAADNFRAVGTEFDATHMIPKVMDRVVEDLSPKLERDAIQMLKKAMGQLKHDNPRGMLTGVVAYNITARHYEVEFRLNRAGTRFMVMGGMPR